MGQDKEAAEEIFLSLVIPVFNEEESLPHLWVQIDRALASAEWAWEAIFVDDGSTDASFAVLGELAKQYPQVCALRFRRNYRKAAALAAGFKQARGQVIVTMDADLQDDPREIPRLLAELNRDYDLVSGWKAKRHDPLSKTLPSRLFNRVTSLVSGVRLRDFNCGLKAYRREVTEDALPYLYGELYRFFARRGPLDGLSSRRDPSATPSPPLRPFQIRDQAAAKRIFGSADRDLCRALYDHAHAHLRQLRAWLHAVRIGHLRPMWPYCATSTGNIQNRHPLLMLGILLIIVGIQCFSIGFLGDMIASMHQRGGGAPRALPSA